MIQGPTNLKRAIPPLICGAHLKPEQSSFWTSLLNLAPKGIKPETLREAHSKILS